MFCVCVLCGVWNEKIKSGIHKKVMMINDDVSNLCCERPKMPCVLYKWCTFYVQCVCAACVCVYVSLVVFIFHKMCSFIFDNYNVYSHNAMYPCSWNHCQFVLMLWPCDLYKALYLLYTFAPALTPSFFLLSLCLSFSALLLFSMSLSLAPSFSFLINDSHYICWMVCAYAMSLLSWWFAIIQLDHGHWECVYMRLMRLSIDKRYLHDIEIKKIPTSNVSLLPSSTSCIAIASIKLTVFGGAHWIWLVINVVHVSNANWWDNNGILYSCVCGIECRIAILLPISSHTPAHIPNKENKKTERKAIAKTTRHNNLSNENFRMWTNYGKSCSAI